MRPVRMLCLTAIAVLLTPGVAQAGGNAGLRRYMATYAEHSAHALIPAWARKHNMNCSGCHYPAVPRLNATGLKFRWAGYRMPEEIGEKADVGKVDNYLAAGVEAELAYDKTEGAPATNSFAAPALVVFYAGPVGRNFSGFLEVEHGPDGEVERIGHVATMWGKDQAFGGLRFGQMHNFFEWGLAGFDRPVGLSAPAPLDGPLTGGVPFVFGEMAVGLEAYYVRGSNRLSGQVLNGITPDGEIGGADADNKKDFLVTDQLLLDDAGSGIQAVGYFGSVVGLDTATAPTLNSHFWRLGVSANKIYRNFELLGGLVYGKDTDLPASISAVNLTGLGYWVSGQYFMPKSSLTLYGRFEVVDPDTDTPDDADRRLVAGAVLPANLPQYLRCAVEYRLDTPQGGAPKTNSLAVGVRLTF